MSMTNTTQCTNIDVGRVYYLELEYEGDKYYSLYGNYAMIDESLCIHFSENRESLSLNSSEIMDLIAKEKLPIYSKITSIHFENEAKRLPTLLFRLDNRNIVSPSYFDLNKLEFTKLIGEGSPGEVFSEELLSENYDWYNKIKIELLFSVYDGGICDYNFYGNDQFYDKEELQLWAGQLEKILNKNDDNSYDEFKALTRELYESRLFYVGWCQS